LVLNRWYWLSIGLAIIGALDSAYLAWIKMTGSLVACSGIGDCESVNSSRYAEFAGIPIALFGLLAYLAFLGLLLVERWKPEWQEGLQICEFGITLFGTIYSIYLTYIEVAVLNAICPFCVISAVAMVVLFVITVIRITMLFRTEELGGS
jgi:uncharacterized membrane protein